MGMIGRWVLGDRRDPRDELAELFGDAPSSGGDIQPRCLAWARNHVDATTMTDVEMIRAFRTEEPRLGLKSAAYLARRVRAHE